MNFRRDGGAVHLFGIVTLLMIAGAVWFILSWQQHLNWVVSQMELTQQHVKLLEMRVAALEGHEGI